MASRLLRLAAAEEEVAGVVALSEHLDDETVITSELQLVKAIEMRGLDPQTVTDAALEARYRTLAECIKNLECHGLVVKAFTIKQRTQLDRDEVAHVDAHKLTALQQDILEQAGCWRLRIVIVIERGVRAPALGLMSGFRARSKASVGEAVDVAKAELDAAAERLAQALQEHGPRFLGIAERDGRRVSEIAGFFNWLLELRDRDVACGGAPLAERMGTARLAYPDLDHIEFRLPAAVAHGAMLGVASYPDVLAADVTLPLLWAPAEFVVCAAWRYVSREFALEQVRLQRRKLMATQDDARSQLAEISEMLDGAVAGRVLLGRCWLGLLVIGRGTSPADRAQALDSAVETVEGALSQQGFSVIREDLAMACAHWSMFPGNWRFAARVVTLTNRNFAALAGLHNAPRAADPGPWRRPLGYFATPYGVPYPFSLHVGDLGNAMIAGPSGSGKTVMLAWIMLHARALGAHVVFLDKDRGANLAVSAFGGSYVSFREGQRTGINPVAECASPAAVRQFLQTMLRRSEADGAAASEIDTAVRSALAVPRMRRRLRHVADALDPAGGLHRDMRRWVRDGDYAWVFDNPAEDIDAGADRKSFLGYDIGLFLDDADLRAPVLQALFARIEALLDGSPTLVVIDEFWRVVGDPLFSAFIRDWLATLRKRNGAVLLATQSLSDVIDSTIARTVIEQAPTKMFFGNRAARRQDYVDGLGLSPEECDLIRALPGNTFLLRRAAQGCVCRLDLGGAGDVLRLLSGRADVMRRFDHALAAGVPEQEAALAAVQQGRDTDEVNFSASAAGRAGHRLSGHRVAGGERGRPGV